MSRLQVAEKLGVSKMTVARMEGTTLHPEKRGKQQRRYFDPYEVNKLAAKTHRLADGEFAATVFRCFEKGETLSSIVQQFEETPERIRSLYKEWRTDLAPGLVSEQHRTRVEELSDHYATNEATSESFALQLAKTRRRIPR